MGVGRSTQRFGGDPNGAANAYIQRIVTLFDTVPGAAVASDAAVPWPSPDEVVNLATAYAVNATTPPKLYEQLCGRLTESGATNANQTAALLHSMQWDEIVSAKTASAASAGVNHRFRTWSGVLHAAYEVMRHKAPQDDFGLIARLDRLDFLMRRAMGVATLSSYEASIKESLDIVASIKKSQAANEEVLKAADTVETYLKLCIRSEK